MRTTEWLALLGAVGFLAVRGQVQAQPPPPVLVGNAPREAAYFYSDLAPYGAWMQLEGCGWCWQPSTVALNRQWRPYCDRGHWVWTDSGWFWQSDYSWGWAPFHYGRWYLHERSGWVWLPDTTWAPAWVTWRVAEGQCGWAPLPPRAEFDVRLGLRFNGVHVRADFDFGLRPEHFTFIAIGDMCERDLGRRRLPPAEVGRIYSHATIINNRAVHDTMVNRGIPVERVAAVTHRPVPKVVIRETISSTAMVSPRRNAGQAELEVYRPRLAAPSKPVAMVAQKVDERHPVVHHPTVGPAEAQRLSAPPSGAAGAAASSRRVPAELPKAEPRPTISKGEPRTQLERPSPRPALEKTELRSVPEKPAAMPAQAARPVLRSPAAKAASGPAGGPVPEVRQSTPNRPPVHNAAPPAPAAQPSHPGPAMSPHSAVPANSPSKVSSPATDAAAGEPARGSAPKGRQDR
jgi:hypothetical protein